MFYIWNISKQDCKGNVQRMGPSVVEFKEVHSDFYLWSLYLRCQAKWQSNFIASLNMKIGTFSNRLLDYSYGLFCWQFHLLFWTFYPLNSFSWRLADKLGRHLSLQVSLAVFAQNEHFLLSTAHFITSRNQDGERFPVVKSPSRWITNWRVLRVGLFGLCRPVILLLLAEVL